MANKFANNKMNSDLYQQILKKQILYNHIDTELSVKLKPIFEALRMIKESESADEKVRTLKNLIVPSEKTPKGQIH